MSDTLFSRAWRALTSGVSPGVAAALLLTNAATAAVLLHALSGGAPLKALRRLLFRAALAAVPASLVSRELGKIKGKMERDLVGSSLEGETLVPALPAQGWPAPAVAATLAKYGAKDRALWASGRISGCVYHGGEALEEVMTSAFRAFAISNPLHPDVFPSLRKVRCRAQAPMRMTMPMRMVMMWMLMRMPVLMIKELVPTLLLLRMHEDADTRLTCPLPLRRCCRPSDRLPPPQFLAPPPPSALCAPDGGRGRLHDAAPV